MANIEKYAIGEQDFRIIRSGCYVYVDKTNYIAKILQDGGRYYFLARPRRFGKSLFLSTLKYFFEGRRELFKGLYVDSVDWDWTEFPVLHLDLNREKYAEPDKLDAVLDKVFREWEEKYKIEVKDTNLPQRFQTIIEEAHRKTGRRVVVLVDEYDKPLVGNINNEDNFEHYRTKLGGIYSNFKSSAPHLQLVFLTGVSRFSKLSVFSDLNNLNDITFNEKFADICGITQKELTGYFQEGIRKLAETEEIGIEEAMKELKRNYDGYRFTAKGSDTYNPWSLLNSMDASKISDYWNDTGMPTLVAESLKRVDADLEDTFDTYCTVSDLKGLDLLNPNPIALLYQTGYLTIKDYDRESDSFRLGIPNREVKRGFFKILVPYYVKNRPLSGNQLIQAVVRHFMFGNPERAMKSLQAYFAGIDYTMRIENENNFHNAFYLLIDIIGLDTETEHHTSEGRIDIVIKTKRFIYVIELKYDRSAEEALQQIEEKHYPRKFYGDNREIILIGASFSSRSRCIESWKIKAVKQ
ncbi:MAG: ATP-binding protein [Muribaculaceae bacterium]|nr:ATP-binding protein [Muribaculaceae bacterium]